MSNYIDNQELFIEPKTTQYGSHMIMTNIIKQTKRKYINIDTRFRDEYNTNTLSGYTIILPEKITEIKTMTVLNIEIPYYIKNISSSIGNNTFKITNIITNENVVIDISDSYYSNTTILSLENNINSKIMEKIGNNDLTINISQELKTSFISNTGKYLIEFGLDTEINNNKYLLKNKLGWLLGFRKITYNIGSGETINSESNIDLNGNRYIYLALDEYSKGNQSSFISPLTKSLINKNILGRVSVYSLNNSVYGNILSANKRIGNLTCDKRSYTGKMDLQKINIQLLDEYGNQINLNGMDFSFCLEVEHE